MLTKNIKINVFSVLVLSLILLILPFILEVTKVKAFVTNPDVTNFTIENSYSLCHDGIDNDASGTTDMGDRNCANFTKVVTPDPEITIETSCDDGIDNDADGTIDMADRDCAGFTKVSDNVVSSSSGGGSRRAKVSNATFAGSTGEYSTATGTCQILTNHMKRGADNNVLEVIVLQAFLNKEMNANLPLTGLFGPLTEQAVKNFQVKYASEILLPWFNAGLSASSEAPTGYVYKTTLHKINSILCAGIKLDAPVLN